MSTQLEFGHGVAPITVYASVQEAIEAKAVDPVFSVVEYKGTLRIPGLDLVAHPTVSRGTLAILDADGLFVCQLRRKEVNAWLAGRARSLVKEALDAEPR